MTAAFKVKGGLLALAVCLPAVAWADTQNTPPNTHHVHKVAARKQELPPPLPSGPQGPVPQVPLDAMPAVAPQVSYQDGLLTIVAPNSTLGEILRSVHKHTSAEIEVPSNANERVVTRLGPAPAREVMAELLNGSRYNYILVGSPENSNELVRVVLVPKTGDTANAQPPPGDNPAAQAAQPTADASENTDVQDDSQPEDNSDQPSEAEQQGTTPDQPVKTPQQMLQEMQQRQMQMQQGQPGQPPYFPGRPGVPQPQQQQQQQEQ